VSGSATNTKDQQSRERNGGLAEAIEAFRFAFAIAMAISLSLAPLDRAQVCQVTADLSARHALPHEMVDNVAARTGGVPLFAEEVPRFLLEGGEKGGIHVIPPSSQQSLTAQLDRLGPAREVAQLASVIGRGFSSGLLRAPTGMADAVLRATLEQLAETDIFARPGTPA
jgi:predicted ATPase